MQLKVIRIRTSFGENQDERSPKTFGIFQRFSTNVRRISFSDFSEGPKRKRMFGENLWIIQKVLGKRTPNVRREPLDYSKGSQQTFAGNQRGDHVGEISKNYKGSRRIDEDLWSFPKVLAERTFDQNQVPSSVLAEHSDPRTFGIFQRFSANITFS